MKMSRTKSMLALASGAVFVGSAAQASVIPVPTLVPVAPPYTAGQLADDPSLAGFCTYDIQVVVSSATGQDRWASGDLRAQLSPGGMFYIPPATDSNQLQAPGTRNATGSRYLQVDTMVDVPIFNATRTTILGKSTFAPASQNGAVFPSNGSNFPDASDPNGTAFEPANDMRLVDVAWGDVQAALQPAGSNGTFTIARLTFKVGSSGTFIGRVGSTGNPSNPVTFTYIVGVPEPTSVALMGIGLGAVALRRRK
jgi:hypothetical protein